MSRTPLHGLKVVEFAGLAPGPFAGLILADWGASVTRVDRVDQTTSTDILCRGKRSLAVNPKVPDGRDLLLKLISDADVLIDPFRPGVLEKLGLGPDVFLGKNGLNSRLVYARLSGFTRTGEYKDMAGHDINYLALTGVLSMLPGPDGKPGFPLNILADFAGGGLMCAQGILLALLSRSSTGKGQVVHSDMVSGARYISSFPLLHSLVKSPFFGDGSERSANILDGGAPFYNVYTCKDGKFMSVGCLEPQFFAVFIENFVKALPKEFTSFQGGWQPTLESRTDRDTWPELRSFLERGFKTKSRDEWARVFYGTDACAVPVLTPAEAAQASSPLPAPHPELLQTPALPLPSTARHAKASLNLKPGHHTEEILMELGLTAEQRKILDTSGALGGEAKARL
ncbi:CoA-transferase family III [Rickenella mellea]|uniref:CoA-transferase family III n=1 Tax=Rickenella mellea TaxID=50990 RepID=A0A4Y7PN65_9AGAM|nr:CoA-transferase family III [Rickenella mellea]